jgi:OFA family oxalate/formate antiporter-like MFS transporter
MPLPRFLSSRYLVLAGAVLMTACLGATYSWSVFVPEIRSLTGLSQSAVQLPFSVFYLAFPITTLFTGPLIARLGTRWCTFLGGLIFGGGWVLAGWGGCGWHFASTVAGIGLLGGIGVGVAYIVPIAACVRWFPERKGLVTGIAVAGFGGGAAAVVNLAGHLMSANGFTAFEVLRLLGIVFAVLVCGVAAVMRFPGNAGAGVLPEAARGAPALSVSRSAGEAGITGASGAGVPVIVPDMNAPLAVTISRGDPPVRFARVVAERAFQVLYFAMFAGLVAGFTVNANLKSLSQSGAGQAGITAVSLFALANAFGRIVWGSLFDRAQRIPAAVLAANLALQGVLLLAAPYLLRSVPGLQTLALLAGFNYGGVLVLYASTVSVRWGAERVGHVYGWLFSANALAAAAPPLAGAVYDRWRTFSPSLVAIAILLLAAAGVVLSRRGALKREL